MTFFRHTNGGQGRKAVDIIVSQNPNLPPYYGLKLKLSETQILHAELKDLVTELTFICPEKIGTVVN